MLSVKATPTLKCTGRESVFFAIRHVAGIVGGDIHIGKLLNVGKSVFLDAFQVGGKLYSVLGILIGDVGLLLLKLTSYQIAAFSVLIFSRGIDKYQVIAVSECTASYFGVIGRNADALKLCYTFRTKTAW